MTIIAAAIKDGKISISCDTQTNFGALKVNNKYITDSNKLFEVNDSVIGVSGWSATCQIVEHLVETNPELFKLDSRWEIFETLLGLQEKLKDDYFIETNEDSDQPVESNQLDALVINNNGIFGFSSYREVNKYSSFWALGSGKRLALGAMHALYETNATAQEIVEAGVKAASTFDDGCDLPLKTITRNIETKNA